jgi:L-lactate utilization protein LutC
MADRRTRTRVFLAVLATLLAVSLSSCGTSNEEYEQQIADLEAELDQTNAQLEATQDQLDATTSELESTQADLEETTAQLDETSAQLSQTEAELLDAQAQLADLGELVLEDGEYNGQVLAAKTTPYRVILFDATGSWRVAQVSDDVYITAGGDEYTLSQFAKLLQSTDPDDIKLVNGPYKVTVKKGLVTSIRKSK